MYNLFLYPSFEFNFLIFYSISLSISIYLSVCLSVSLFHSNAFLSPTLSPTILVFVFFRKKIKATKKNSNFYNVYKIIHETLFFLTCCIFFPQLFNFLHRAFVFVFFANSAYDEEKKTTI